MSQPIALIKELFLVFIKETLVSGVNNVCYNKFTNTNTGLDFVYRLVLDLQLPEPYVQRLLFLISTAGESCRAGMLFKGQ